ncbi:MAG: hypothetical protein QOF02_3642 [Blastocatellia bacterium]|jgi:hypothetical protein|nr:hypothetical protein [Blastocatellia bacterium]
MERALTERRSELTVLQEEFRAFKTRYTQMVGGRLAELAEVERAIKEAEARLLGVEEAEAEETIEEGAAEASSGAQAGGGLRKLFWAVARMFHPDHATDEGEARRRHTVMAEANRAYREGDVESLHTLLGDEELQFFCAGAQAEDDPLDLAGRIVLLKEELRTVEFGIKRIKQNGLYQLKLSVEEEARHNRDALAAQAERIQRQIVKARHKLEHLS